MKYAVVKSDTQKVVNIVEWDGVSQWSPPKDCYLLQRDDVGLGQILELSSNRFVDDTKTIKNTVI